MIYKENIEASAEMSNDGQYRYWLKRVWDDEKEIGIFIALNPSKATALKCDQTMCNINNLALQWNFGGFYILNLFAFMATDKNKMLSIKNPIGDDNDKFIIEMCKNHHKIILCWGEEKPKLVKDRANYIRNILSDLKKDIYCLSKNKSSGYKHPCIIKVENFKQPKKIKI